MSTEKQAEEAAPSSPISRMTFKNDKPFTIKPIIRDICEDICIPGSIMLVEKIENIEATLLNPSATRLLLGDGELCIQAFLNPVLNNLVEDGEVTTGCYVRLEKFHVERVDMEAHEQGLSSVEGKESKKRKRPQQVIFLKIDQLDTIGWDFPYMNHINGRQVLCDNRQDQEQLAREEVDMTDVTDTTDTTRMGMGKRQSDESALAEDLDLQEDFLEQSTYEDNFDPSSDWDDDEVSRIAEDSEKGRDNDDLAQQVIVEQSGEPLPEKLSAPRPNSSSGLPDTFNTFNKPHEPSVAVDPTLRAFIDTKQIPVPPPNRTSLVPRTLASLSKLPTRQNSPCTVFAIIDEIAPVKPCPIPPNRTREVRLVDPSTSKRVLLSVLWQPEKFEPAVGTPCLLRGLKNHRYDGGSLNAYPKSVSPFTQNADGTDWWIPFPRGWDGCDVDGYVKWWQERRQSK